MHSRIRIVGGICFGVVAVMCTVIGQDRFRWQRRQAAFVRLRQGYGHSGYFKSLKEIAHFHNTRDVLPRCAPHDPREGTGCWPAPETTENVNKSKTGNLDLTEQEENALVAFMQTLTDGYVSLSET